MARPNLIMIFCVSLGLFFISVDLSSAQTIIRGAILHGVGINQQASSQCPGAPTTGSVCTGGALYAGLYNGYHYMTTPGGCTDYANNHTSFTPTCSGGADTVMHAWANDSGTTGYGVNTGATSQTDGKSNTTILLNYTDTDAARYCYYMSYGGYTDWFLPSLYSGNVGELYNVLYHNRALLGGFVSSDYWSSTEYSTVYAWFQNFTNSLQDYNSKTNANHVRCVRRY